MPDGTERAPSIATSVIGRAGAATGPAVVRPDGREPPATSTVPQAWHSPQRPTHLAVVQPHSAHA